MSPREALDSLAGDAGWAHAGDTAAMRAELNEAVSVLEGLIEQYKNELDDMTGQFCNEAIHLTRAEDRVRELEEQLRSVEEQFETAETLIADMDSFIRFLRPDLTASRDRADRLVKRANALLTASNPAERR